MEEVECMSDSRRRWARAAVMGIAAATIGLGLAACGSDSGGGGPKIALLLPESKTTRYEAHDHPEFEDAVNAACSDCDIIYSNANQDAAQQQSQMEAALTDGADVVVLDPVDSASALSKKLAADGSPTGPIVRINGSATDNNAKLFGQGAESEFNKAGVQVAKEYDTPEWDPANAQSEMDQA